MRYIDTALYCEKLTKHFGDIVAVDKLNLSVRVGEIYGFLGRNGAGKTTTIRMLLGLIKPSTGKVMILGNDVSLNRIKAVKPVGSLVETATSYGNLTVRENLTIHSRLIGASPVEVHKVIELFKLQEYVNRKAARLSLGNKQRLALARASLNTPRVLILDEPANALDPAGIVEIRESLRSMCDSYGVTVLVSTHILSEIEQLADRIGIIHQGKLIEEIDLKNRKSNNTLELKVTDIPTVIDLLKNEFQEKNVEITKTNSLLVYNVKTPAVTLTRAIIRNGIGLEMICPVEENLENHFLQITGGDK